MLFVKKIHFFESIPEPKVWESMVDVVDGKTVSKTPWVISEKLNGDTQKIISETKNDVSKMIEHEFKDFAGQHVSLRMKTRS